VARKQRILASVSVAVALIAATMLMIGPASAETNGGTRVMPLGDSITDGLTVAGGYRISLWQRLSGSGFRIDFVGSLSNGPGSLGDHDHEGHSGWTISQIDASIIPWLQTTSPRTVLLHIGTNDMFNNSAGAPARLSTLIDHITATVPNADVFVATIIPLSGADTQVRTFNGAIPGIVQAKVNAGRHVHLVDMFNALTLADLADGVHPNAGGYGKMAAVWDTALRSVPGSIGASTPPTTRPPTTPPATTPPATTPPPTTPPPTTPPPSGGCSISLVTQSQWPTGYVIEPSRVTNTGANAISGWTVRVTLPAGHAVTGFWNATESVSGQTVTFRGLSWNSNLAPGASGEFGFQASRPNGNTAVPTATCTAP
jgi:cellulase/cellobiase CelA1